LADTSAPAPRPARAGRGQRPTPRRRQEKRTGGTLLARYEGLRTFVLLVPPMLWLGVAYLTALGALFLTSFWGQDDFTGQIVRVWTLDNYRTMVDIPVYRTVAFRTIGVAALVTVVDAVIAFPIALYMAKFASPRGRRLMVISVLMPLWASYLVKAYAWRGMFSEGGLIDWVGQPFGIQSPGYGLTATIITLAYLWLPYMILPIFAGLERVPDSLFEASSDLGAGSWTTTRRIVLPMAFPAVVAGSIFTFSLSLGDYIAVTIVGGTTQLLGNVIATNVGAANNLPFAAALSTIPVAVMLVYLAVVRRTGALENL
jgi:putative spermidine/putrescine transport system permease protein